MRAHSYEGYHETCDCQLIEGWAWDRSRPNNPIKVDIYADDTLLITVSAGEFRQDLADAGMGDGRHGFRVPFPFWLKDKKPHLIRVRVAGANVDLHSTPRIIKCECYESELYTKGFFSRGEVGRKNSAKEIVPLVIELVHPLSVIDVGCGVGTWLSIFREYGVKNILGVDGPWVDKSMLQIPIDNFLSLDLKEPFRINGQFDLVVSIEVAEHLPPECAEQFVGCLVSLGPVILFSAALPFQGGTNHLNEQWPEYWAKHFLKKGYITIDCIRKMVWQNDNVEWWYAQNMLIFCKRERLKDFPSLKQYSECTCPSQLSVIHPKNYMLRIGVGEEARKNLSPES